MPGRESSANIPYSLIGVTKTYISALYSAALVARVVVLADVVIVPAEEICELIEHIAVELSV